MPPITLSSISSAVVKVRWKEPYASEGLNRKMAVVVPAGVYRGLKLGVSASNLSVDLLVDAAGDHVAIQESSTGFSTTYTDDSSGTITLPLTGFVTNDVVVICLVVNYAVGASTTAEFRGYVLSEFDALTAAVRDGLVVLGTVLRPAAGIIPAVNITHDRRTLPFLRRADEATPWNPLIRNGGFELGQTNGTYRHSSPFWKTSSSNANFTIRPVTTEAHSGAKSLEMINSVVGVVSATIQQELWMPVTPGRFLMARLYKKAIQAATTSPSGRIRFLFGDLDGINDVQEDLLFDIAAVDGSFEEFSGIVKVPATARVLKAVQIILAGTYSGTGPCIRIDDVQAWAQVDGANWLDVQDTRVREAAVGDMFLGAANSFGNNSAKLSFDGSVIGIERRDELQTALPPALSIPGRSFTDGIRYTLLFQSAIPFSSFVVYYRKYVSSLSLSIVETINASFDNGTTLWSKDLIGLGAEASKHEIAYGGVRIHGRSGSVADDAPWSDGSWKQYVSTAVPEVATVANPKFAPLLEVKDSGGNRRVVVDHNGFVMSRCAMIRESWWSTNGSAPVGWTDTDVGGGGNFIGDYGIARIDVGATATDRHSLRTSNSKFIPFGETVAFLAAAEWEWSPNQVNIFLPQCKFVMGFFDGGPLNLLADSGLWIGARETDTNWQLAGFQFAGGGSNYWTEAAATGQIVNTGVAVSSATQRMRIEVYGSSASFGGRRAVAYINGSLVAEITNTLVLPNTNMGFGMELYRVSTTGTRSASIGELLIRHNRRRASEDAL